MNKEMKKVNIAQIGLGNWGPNLLRNFYMLDNCMVKYCFDINSSQWDKFAKDFPDVDFVDDINIILGDQQVQAVVIATPAPTHYEIAKRALEAGKHVYVEKPITLNLFEANALIRLAKENNRKLMVGHLMLYHPAITKLKELITIGELGDIYYIYTQRLNLGRIRNTENVMWSLAPHDISIVLYLMGKNPSGVVANGSSFVQKGIEDVVFLNVKFSGGELGNIHVSWLDPTKTRKTIVVGSKKMAIFDEISARGTLTLIDRGVKINSDFKNFEEFLKLRFGIAENIEIIKEEPLRIECRHFIDSIIENNEPISNGENGVAVLRVLEAAQRSLLNGGSNELL